MMINKRLIKTVSESKKYIAANVALQWLSLIANIAMTASITILLAKLFSKTADIRDMLYVLITAIVSIAVRYICTVFSSKTAYLSSKAVKKTLREMIYKKLLKLGSAYNEKVSTSEIVQVAVEGVDQLETYFGAYLPQFFYAMLAPLTLFAVLSFINLPSALVLLVCVPLIPIAIAAVQTWAKKLLSKYWGEYTALGDTFLENLQGLTTLKIYKADEFKHRQMNEQSEKFRKITMKVLTMQLNSITIMDLIAYGGAALGIITATTQYAAGNVTLAGALFIILISAEFFIPMRLLGSFFHIAMNGMAASDKIFRLLDMPEPDVKTEKIDGNLDIVCSDLGFSYTEDRQILSNVNMTFKEGTFTSIVGESGCGKSTVSNILTGKNKGYSGSVKIGKKEISDICEDSIAENITYISHQSYLFKGTVRDNLLMGNPNADKAMLWNVLKRVKLDKFLEGEQGLDTPIAEKGGNLSGGQCQRLALARALLHDSPVYIFDEATSNIDVESENDIMEEIIRLAEDNSNGKRKTVILISHRLANAVHSDNIYVMQNGAIAESGTHSALLEKNGVYSKLWNAQQSLENLCEDGEE